MPALPTSDKLQHGSRYTFHFRAQGIIVLDSAIVQALTVAYSFLSDIKETRAFFGSEFAVSFVWLGLPTPISTVAGNMVDILGPVAAPLFLSAEGGDVVQEGSPGSLVDSITSPIKETASSLADSVAGFFSGLKTTAISLIIGIVAIVVLVLILAAYGPNVRHIAAAL